MARVRPLDHLHSALTQDLVKPEPTRSVWRPKDNRSLPGDFLNGVLSAIYFLRHPPPALEIGQPMRVSMIPDGMPLRIDPANNLRISFNILSTDKKCGWHTALADDVKDLFRKRRCWAVIKSEGNA